MAGAIPATALVEDAPAVAGAAAVTNAPEAEAAPTLNEVSEARDGLQTLAEWLREAPFALALASSFFGFYAHAGALQGTACTAELAVCLLVCSRRVLVPALEEAGIVPARLCGSSSGAIVASLYVRPRPPRARAAASEASAREVASGLTLLPRVLRPQAGGLDATTALPELLLSLRRQDILTPFWRRGGGRGGVFRINQTFIAANAPISLLEDARLPLAISTYDVFARRTVVHRSGPLAATIAASCAIPVVMQPVMLAGRLHVDGFVEDLLALDSCGMDERVLSVNLHFRGAARALPRANKALLGARGTAEGGREVPGCRHGERPHTTLLQLHNLPLVGPTSMQTAGAKALAAGRDAMRAALQERRRWGGQRIHAVKPAPRSI